MSTSTRSNPNSNRPPRAGWAWLSGLLLVFSLAIPAEGQDRTEVVNRSNQPWTLALVEGHHSGRGTLTLVDKFTGRVTGSLAKVGDAVTVPAQGRVLVVFNRDAGYVYRDFILKDPNGYYAEYLATVEFLSSPRVSISLVDHHVGPPMDQSDEIAIKQFLGDAIEIGCENIIIHPNSIGMPKSDGKHAKESRIQLSFKQSTS